MADEAELRRSVAVYCQEHRNPGKQPFRLYKHSLKSWYGKPEGAMPGCYAYLDDAGEVLYIGKASFRAHVGNRLYSHDNRTLRAAWRNRAHFVLFVIVSEPFEAPSLEEFLIGELHPPGNTVGRFLLSSSISDTTR